MGSAVPPWHSCSCSWPCSFPWPGQGISPARGSGTSTSTRGSTPAASPGARSKVGTLKNYLHILNYCICWLTRRHGSGSIYYFDEKKLSTIYLSLPFSFILFFHYHTLLVFSRSNLVILLFDLNRFLHSSSLFTLFPISSIMPSSSLSPPSSCHDVGLTYVDPRVTMETLGQLRYHPVSNKRVVTTHQ